MSRSQFQSKRFILRHAWLNLWDERMTTGRINQVATIISLPPCRPAPVETSKGMQLGREMAVWRKQTLQSSSTVKEQPPQLSGRDMGAPISAKASHWLSDQTPAATATKQQRPPCLKRQWNNKFTRDTPRPDSSDMEPLRPQQPLQLSSKDYLARCEDHTNSTRTKPSNGFWSGWMNTLNSSNSMRCVVLIVLYKIWN